MPRFQSYIGIDYSGAETPDSSRKGLRVYLAEGSVERLDLIYGVHANLRQRRPESFVYHSHRRRAGVADFYVRIIPVTTLRLDRKINNADAHALKRPARNIVSIPIAVSYMPLPSALSVQTSTQRISRTL